MKVVCIDNTYLSLSLTIGKTYDVLKSGGNWDELTSCLINDDKECVAYFGREHFKTVVEIRDEKLKKLGI